MPSPEQPRRSLVERIRAVPESTWIIGFIAVAAIVFLLGLLHRQGRVGVSVPSVSRSAPTGASDKSVPASAPHSSYSPSITGGSESSSSPGANHSPETDTGNSSDSTPAHQISPEVDAIAKTLPPIRLNEIISGLRGNATGVFVLQGGQPSPRRIGAGVAPSISPDGRKVVYAAPDATHIAQIFISGVDSADAQQLTSTPGAKGHPSWSPDSSKIAYSSREEGHYQIFVCNADGGEQKLLVASLPGVNDVTPEWSPTEDKIAFRSDRDGNNEIYVFSIRDGVAVNISQSAAIDVTPTWSADGKHLIWASDRDGGKFEIYSGTPGTPGLSKLSSIGGALSPYCSPDASYISVLHDHSIQFLTRTGHPLEKVSAPGVLMRGFMWSRHGDQVAFSRSAITNAAMERTGHGAARVVAGPFSAAREATREAWSLEISGFFSDVRRINGQWFTVVGERLSAAEARDLVARLERARFTARIENGG